MWKPAYGTIEAVCGGCGGTRQQCECETDGRGVYACSQRCRDLIDDSNTSEADAEQRRQLEAYYRRRDG